MVKTKSKLRPKGSKFDGKSRVSNDKYRKNWNEIFNKKGGVVNTEESFKSKEYNDRSN